MARVCDCDNVSLNTGVPGCVPIADIVRCLIFTTEVDSAGAVKEISKTDLASFSAVELLLNDVDFEDRLLPTAELENVENIRDESVFQEFNSGNKAKVRDGFKNFTGMIVQPPRELKGKLERLSCSDFGAYAVDKSGNFLGYAGSTTDVLRPILIDKNTLDVQYVEATDSEVAMIMIKFQWKLSQKDENIKLIGADDLDYTCSDLYGLLDVNASYSAISTTGFTATLTTDYGTNVTGLVAGDFTLYNETTASSVVISSATETSAGVYEFSFAAQTPADVLTLSASKNRYDFAGLGSSNIVIP
jgi:hypothetical protein